MDNDYWGNNEPILANKKELEEPLYYEIQMFFEICKKLELTQVQEMINGDQLMKNIFCESFSIHVRTLLEFFYKDRIVDKYPNDLVPRDFLKNDIDWKKERPPITELLRESWHKADKQLAHISRWRIKIEKDGKKEWDWKGIRMDMEKVIKTFDSFRQ
jgi:hypothetical protein